MNTMSVPYAVAMAEHHEVYAGPGNFSIDEFVQRYVESGDALREWVQRWAVAQQILVLLVDANGGTDEEPGP